MIEKFRMGFGCWKTTCETQIFDLKKRQRWCSIKRLSQYGTAVQPLLHEISTSTIVFSQLMTSVLSGWILSLLKKNEIQINVKSSSGFRIQNIRLTREIKGFNSEKFEFAKSQFFFCWQLQIHKKNCGFLSSIKFVKTPCLLLHEKNC